MELYTQASQYRTDRLDRFSVVTKTSQDEPTAVIFPKPILLTCLAKTVLNFRKRIYSIWVHIKPGLSIVGQIENNSKSMLGRSSEIKWFVLS